MTNYLSSLEELFKTLVTQARLTPNFLASSARFFTLPESSNFRYSLACSARESFFLLGAFRLTEIGGLQKFALAKKG